MKTQDDLLFEKGLPANLDAERFVLGSVLLNCANFDSVCSVLKPDAFSLQKHQRIFARMMDLAERGEPIDRITIADELISKGQLDSVDGLSYLISLDEGLPEVANLDAYVNIVNDKATLRKAILLHQRAVAECLEASEPTREILDRSERMLAELGTGIRGSSFRSPTDVINRAGGITAILYPEAGQSIQSPWPRLNRMLVGRGLQPGQMVVVGARPSMGKTALACQIADHAATSGTGVAFFTLEMADKDILFRMAAARAQVDWLKITQAIANDQEIQALGEAFADLTREIEDRLWIDDTTGCTVPAIRSALRKLMARHSIGLVVIDYLQLVETSGGTERRRYEQVSEISRAVKRLARQFNIPILVLAQLNRETEKEARRPMLSDLRDSGSIEQDADIVLFPARKADQDEQADSIKFDLIIAKQRNGPKGIVPLLFLKRYAKFVEPPSEAASGKTERKN